MPLFRSGVPMPNFTATQELFRADGLTISSNSNTVTAAVTNQVNNVATGIIDVSSVANGVLIVNVGAVSGTTPALALFFDVQDAYGNWVQVSGATSITPAALTAAGAATGNISAGDLLAFNGRLRWTVTGTTPAFTGVSFNIFGR